MFISLVYRQLLNRMMLPAVNARYPTVRKSLLCLTDMFSKRQKSSLNVSEASGIRRIVLSDSKTRNALSVELLNQLITHVTCSPDDLDLRCIVISAEGPVFSAGHNLKLLSSAEERETVFSTCSRLMLSMIECPVPVIAAVDGLAAAAGCQLVAQADIAVCTRDSTFSTPGANFGLFCSTPGIPLVRCVPRKIAAHMLFTGLSITASNALAAGLVSIVAQDSLDLEKELNKITDAITSKSRSVIELGKKFFYEQLDHDLKTAYSHGEVVMLRNLSYRDAQEGLQSFVEKRKPVWRHQHDT